MRYWLFGFWLLASCSVLAQPRDMIIRQWSTQQGLNYGWINDIQEDVRGNIWAASESGLYRLTQTKALQVPMPAGTDPQIYFLVPDGKNGLYVGTGNSLLHLSPNEGLQTLTDSQQSPLLRNGGVFSATMFDQQLWVLTANGQLTRWMDNQLHVVTAVDQSIAWRQVTHDKRFLYLLSTNLIRAVDPQTQQQFSLTWQPGKDGTPKSLYVDQQQRLWLASENGLFQIILQKGQWQVKAVLRGHYFRQMTDDGHSGLYLTGRYGVQHYNIETGQLDDYTQQIAEKTEIEGLIPIFRDHNGLVWAGALGEGMLAMIPKASKPLAQYNKQTSPALTSNQIWSILPEQNAVWLATDAGLEKVQGNEHQLYRPANFGINDGFYAVSRYGQQIAVCGLTGFYLFDPTSAQFQQPLAKSPWAGKTCLGMAKDDDSLLIGGPEHLVRWSPTRVQGWSRDANGRGLADVKVFARQGKRLWAAGRAGLLEYKNEQWQRLNEIPGHIINALQVMDDHRLLVGFDSHGVWQVDTSGAEPVWTNLSEKWQLPNETVFFIRKHASTYYIGLQDVLVRVQPQPTLKIDAFFQEDGLPDSELNEGAATMTADGTLWIGSVHGVAAFTHGSLKHRLTNMHSGIVSVSATDAKGQTNTYWYAGQLPKVLPADLSMLRIQVGSQNYASTRPPAIRYLLHGRGKPIELASESPIYVGNPSFGSHQLKVWFKHNGLWSNNAAVVNFTIATPWFRTWWFYSLLILLGLSIMLAVAYNRRRHHQQLQRAYRLVTESEQQLRTALHGANANSWDWRADDDRFYINRADIHRPGEDIGVLLKPEEVPLHPDDKKPVFRAWFDHLRGNIDRYDVEYRLLLQEGIRWFHVIGKVVERNSDGKPQRISGIYQDITERKLLEGEVTLYARAFENTAEGVMILDSRRRVLSSNPAVAAISGYSRQTLSGQPLAFLMPSEDDDSELWLNVDNSGAWTGETKLRRKDGSECVTWLNVSQMSDPLSSRHNYVVVFSDMTERKAAESELRRLANYDVLTGLPNRALFMQTLTQSLAEAKRHDRRMALLFMDLDRFKTVNDTYGHRVGDGLLIEAANRLRERISSRDTVARLGGDEFVVIIHDVESPEALIPICESLLQALSDPFQIYGREFFLSTSIGISLFPDDGQQPETLLRNADMAMYHAKDEGRNNMQFYCHDRNAEAVRLIQLENDLRLALERDEFFVTFQPQVDVLEGEKVVAVEALVRWQHPSDGLISPDTFIKVAENTGLIANLDNFVMRHAMAGVAEIAQNSEHHQLSLSVNISAAHFRQHDFVQQVEELLEQTHFPADKLCLEITESTLMREVGTAREHLTALSKLGIKVAVDDFGTGYSSLAYLKQFAVNELKVDKSFVHDLADSEADAAIVRSVVDLARNLNLKVVAEGVETEQQLDLCLALGCYRVQGYYYARPMILPDLKQWLLASNNERTR